MLSRGDVAEEGEESQNERETEEVEVETETETVPRVQSDLTDGRKTGLQRAEGRRNKTRRDQEGTSPWVCEWRLSLEGAIRVHKGGDFRGPTSPSSSLCTGP